MNDEKNTTTPATAEPRPVYEPPRVTVMDQKAVLEVFQITSAGASWWG